MILYFSGTGNSEYAAKRIGKEIDDAVINVFEKIKKDDFSEMHSDLLWVMSLRLTLGEYRASCRGGWKTQTLREAGIFVL